MKEIYIGRDSSNNVVLNDPQISKKHLLILQKDDGSFWISDQGSTNGTKVNGWKIKPKVLSRLNPGSKVVIGKTALDWEAYFQVPEEEPVIQEEPAPSIIKPEVISVEQPQVDPIKVDLQPIIDKYDAAEQKIFTRIDDYLQKLRNTKPIVTDGFSAELLISLYSNYEHDFDQLKSVLDEVSDITIQLQTLYQEDSKRLQLSRSQAIRAEYVNETLVQQEELNTRHNALREKVSSDIKDLICLFDEKHQPIFPNRYDMATAKSSIWEEDLQHQQVSTFFYLGRQNVGIPLFDETIFCHLHEYIELICNKNLFIRHKSTQKQDAINIVNTLLGRAFYEYEPGAIQVDVIDTEEMTGLSSSFRKLRKNIYRNVVRETEVQNLLNDIELHIEGVITNVLEDDNQTLFKYNRQHESKIGYRFLVVKDFANTITDHNANQLKRIMRLGTRAGVCVIVLADDYELNHKESVQKALLAANFSPDIELDLVNNKFPAFALDRRGTVDFEILTADTLAKIVKDVNEGFNDDAMTTYLQTDYLPVDKDWWKGRSASFIGIPFGMTAQKKICELEITQESGQNSAVVIGIPGSGKSVFLHAIILNSCVKYSPDELQLYLVDFSGVEFNTYALHNLPHARVIAPEAEREFGLSVLRELKEEGRRREILCRENNVSNIVELKRQNPSMVVPRLLAIIDEFQKFFEIDNDPISREAVSIIHVIIQEYRKFGINLILATQQLPSTAILPRDMIANRIVFKSKPADFEALIHWPYNTTKPDLGTGECIYNNEAGSPNANNFVKGFFASKTDIENILTRISSLERSSSFQKQYTPIVFRSNEQPKASIERQLPEHRILQDIPTEFGFYLGSSIAISAVDVFASMRKASGNNLLIVGHDEELGRNIALCSTMSVMSNHKDDSADSFVLNFAYPEDPFVNIPGSLLTARPFRQVVSHESKTDAEVMEVLNYLKSEIDNRKTTKCDLYHCYLTIFSFQLSPLFDKEGKYGSSMSEAASLLLYILKQGPTVGVFTTLQVDRLECLNKLDNPLNLFMHRVALQMSENDSNKLMGSSAANKLRVENRPATRFRAYYFNATQSAPVKFIPYQIIG